MKNTCKVRVKNALGLHTRPATSIVQMLQSCKSKVRITYRRQTIDAKSILSILMLAVHKNANITIDVEGSDSDIVMKELVDAFENKFGEG
ncbi:MAG: HPr family phosphocarrier protein [Waddliaceae bacterium]|jgi:phosphocarrier protein HPr|nr:HPr family phosphocarrier protein [Waddliaceae bacterium]MBT3578718.1 HPr family phosphocarrier protein [Waddliaceae bacterium]MBT4444380.1 HPr family phosphocarrier protein [Waddliaceae bacterium]MBT6928295.1 HPr family phosphocarrier protein [Waddliaceae bacterium]MBT7264981.1 HPr family phosphocarrier protein [Waddliaceae bacterium]